MNPSSKALTWKALTWSFCDEPTEAFRCNLDVFKKWLPTHTCRSNVSESEKQEIYKYSLFVLIQDVVKIEEVIRAGAIPVCIGFTTKPIQSIIYEPTAVDAVKRCIDLMKNLSINNSPMLQVSLAPSMTPS